VVPVLLLVVAIPAFGAARKSSSHPPRELHLAGDHWTAYNPPDPATWPAGSKTYIIKRGDTLWALAQQFFKNAYTWPQLWESNTWITDAHWIYPGDVLLIDSEAVPIASNPPGPGPNPPNLPVPAPLPQPNANPGSPIPLGSEFDVYCYGYSGQLRVLCADDHHARGIITQSCEDIHVGARLKPLPQLPIPLARVPDMPEFCNPSSGKSKGYIVSAQGGWDTALGEGLLVQVN